MTNTKTIDVRKAESDARKFCKKFLKEEFDLNLDIPVKINARLSKTLGFFTHYSGRGRAVELNFSKKLFEVYSMEDIIGVLKHECTHYALYELGKPFHDGDEYFENYLKKVGASSTGTIRAKHPMHTWECDTCSNKYVKHKKMNYSNSYCSGCGIGSKIIYLGKQTF